MNKTDIFALAQYYEHIYLLYSLNRDRETLLITGKGDQYAKVDGMTLSMLNCVITGKQIYVDMINAMSPDSELLQTKAELDGLCDFFDIYYMPGRGKVAKMLLGMCGERLSPLDGVTTLFADMNTCVFDPWEMDEYVTKFQVSGDDIRCMDRGYKINKLCS